MKRVAIIGGGVAGMSAALSLERRGVPSIVLERASGLGGQCGELGCKGVERCVRCDACLAQDLVPEVRSSLAIERAKGVEIASISGRPGDFRIIVKGGESEKRRTVRAGAIICATGAEPFDARLDKRLAYGEAQDVMTSLDIDRQLRATGKVTVPSTGLPPGSVAFVLCVGSRDERFQTSYCSKACCKYSFKLAQALKALDPLVRVTFLFMDWRLYDPKENVRQWSVGQADVELVRSRPAEVFLGEDARPEVRFAKEGDKGIESRAFDLVVLSLGMRPRKGTREVAKRLRVELDELGFMRSIPGDPCASTRPGVFLAGACRGPMDIVESAKDGAEAANRAVAFLEGRR